MGLSPDLPPSHTFSFVMGLYQVVLSPLMQYISESISDDAREGFVMRLAFWTALVAAVGAWNAWLWGRAPPPVAGSVSMDVVREARAAARR